MVHPPPAAQLYEADQEVIPRAEREDLEVTDLDFNLQSAQDIALEDWKIDIEREANERKVAAATTFDFQDKCKNELNLIEFERLSEFFYDLCLS